MSTYVKFTINDDLSHDKFASIGDAVKAIPDNVDCAKISVFAESGDFLESQDIERNDRSGDFVYCSYTPIGLKFDSSDEVYDSDCYGAEYNTEEEALKSPETKKLFERGFLVRIDYFSSTLSENLETVREGEKIYTEREIAMENQITGQAAEQMAKDFKEASDAMIAMEQYRQLSEKLQEDGYSKEQVYAYICGMSDIGAAYKDAAISDLKDALGKQSAMLESLMRLYNSVNAMADILMDSPGYNRKVQEALNTVYKDLHTSFTLATSPASSRIIDKENVKPMENKGLEHD